MAYNLDRVRIEKEVKVETYRASSPGEQRRKTCHWRVRLNHQQINELSNFSQ
jgi:hypothetical protein